MKWRTQSMCGFFCFFFSLKGESHNKFEHQTNETEATLFSRMTRSLMVGKGRDGNH